MTSILLASTPPMLPRWYLTNLRRRKAFVKLMDCKSCSYPSRAPISRSLVESKLIISMYHCMSLSIHLNLRSITASIMINELSLSKKCQIIMLPNITKLLFCDRFIVCSRHVSPNSTERDKPQNLSVRCCVCTSGAVPGSLRMSSMPRVHQSR